MKTLFLDTETTGLHPPRDKLVEVAIIGLDGKVLLNTLVNPGRKIGSGAIAIHHITDDMVATAPTLKQLWPEIQDVVRGSHLIIYNSAFDTRFFPGRLGCARKVTCAMKRFARIYGQWNPKYGDHRWQKLIKAAEHVGYTWECEAHRALGDVLATRAVWKWMEKQDSDNEGEGVIQDYAPVKVREMNSKYCTDCGTSCMQTMCICPACGNKSFSDSPLA